MNSVSFVGNLTREARLSYSQSGTAIARFTVAVNEGQGDNEKAHFASVTAFGTLAENLADSTRKGMRVVIIGRFDGYKKAVTIEGEEKNIDVMNFIASAVGPDLRFAVAKVAKVEREASKPAETAPADDNGDEATEEAPKPAARKAPAAVASSAAKSRAKAPAPAEDPDEF